MNLYIITLLDFDYENKVGYFSKKQSNCPPKRYFISSFY